jgi:uncharacterized LabA/DUF88 family protein
MNRYAFIDVHNTKSSATILDFTIDPQLLYKYLVYDKWSCKKVFWYAGRIDNDKFEKERAEIEKIGFTMRDKPTKFFKKTNRIKIDCPKCGHPHEHIDIKRRMPKANCDVELTVDCIEMAKEGDEFLIFTGDGDFKYLIEKLRDKGVKVRLFSTRKRDKWGDYRFSTRYFDLLESGEGKWIYFMELDNLKRRLQKIDPEAS